MNLPALPVRLPVTSSVRPRFAVPVEKGVSEPREQATLQPSAAAISSPVRTIASGAPIVPRRHNPAAVVLPWLVRICSACRRGEHERSGALCVPCPHSPPGCQERRWSGSVRIYRREHKYFRSQRPGDRIARAPRRGRVHPVGCGPTGYHSRCGTFADRCAAVGMEPAAASRSALRRAALEPQKNVPISLSDEANSL